MAKGFKTGGKDFEKGHTLSTGPHKVNPVVKAVRKMTNDEVAHIITMLIESREEELRSITLDEDATYLRKMIAKASLVALERGDLDVILKLLDRLLGKPKEISEIKGDVTVNNTTVYLENARAALKYMKAKGELDDGSAEGSGRDEGEAIKTTGERIS